MEVEYKKDLRHNYMVITEIDNSKLEPYSMKMLEKESIDGFLPVEKRRMDNKILLYYDITAKQPMEILLDKAFLTYDKVTKLCEAIIRTIEGAYEYLLSEDDFILKPQFIYMTVTTNEPILCYLPGYGRRIKEQMSSLIEYMMNKVDYNDKEAVLLVYQLYAVSREEGYTFDHLTKMLKDKSLYSISKKENSHQFMKEKQLIERDDIKVPKRDNLGESDKKHVNSESQIDKKEALNIFKKGFLKSQPSQQGIDDKIPVMMEKLEGEQEESCYPWKTYICTGASLGIGILFVFLCLRYKLLYNFFGSRIDYSKLFAFAIIILSIEGYLLKKIWDKKNMITRIVATNEYIDPRENLYNKESIGFTYPTAPDEDALQGNSLTNNRKVIGGSKTLSREVALGEEVDNPTCILNSHTKLDNKLSNAFADADKRLLLKSLNEGLYKDIFLDNIPFFIGKLKKNVDYCLEKDVVSRYHAKITKEESQFYIVDLNSTNGTFINGEGIPAYVKQEIQIGDEISFADIKYRFIEQ